MPNRSPSSPAADFRRRQFDRAAKSYDRHSAVQRIMASELAELLPKSSRFPCVLELGCGTGHLSELLIPITGRTLWLTDVSARMLSLCGERFAHQSGDVEIRLAELDATGAPEAAAFLRARSAPPFALIASNAVVQWFPELAAHFAFVRELLEPNGAYLCSGFSSLNFPELRAIVAELPFGYRDLAGHEPELVERAARQAGFTIRTFQKRSIVLDYASVDDYFTTIRKLGASRFPKYSRLTPDTLRRLKQLYEDRHSTGRGVSATWTPWYALLRSSG